MNNQPSGLVLAGVSKRFGATRALIDGDLHLRPGEIHTLLGENGSGKSTLVKIMGGVHRPDSGAVTLDGVPVTSRSPRAAMDLGIATVFQEVLTAGSQSVLENVWLGSHGVFRRRLGRAEQRAIAQDVLTRIAGEIPLDLPAGQALALRAAVPLHCPRTRAQPQGAHPRRVDGLPGRQLPRPALRRDAPARGRGHRHPVHLAPHGRGRGDLGPGHRPAVRAQRLHRGAIGSIHQTA